MSHFIYKTTQLITKFGSANISFNLSVTVKIDVNNNILYCGHSCKEKCVQAITYFLGGRGKSRVTYGSYTHHTKMKIKNNNGRSIVYTRKLHSISENISKIVTEDKIICIYIIVV